jgi:hypothetical protein
VLSHYGISFEGDEKNFLDFLILIDEVQCQEDLLLFLRLKRVERLVRLGIEF